MQHDVGTKICVGSVAFSKISELQNSEDGTNIYCTFFCVFGFTAC